MLRRLVVERGRFAERGITFVHDLGAVLGDPDDARVARVRRVDRGHDLDRERRHVGRKQRVLLERELVLEVLDLAILGASVGAQLGDVSRQAVVVGAQRRHRRGAAAKDSPEGSPEKTDEQDTTSDAGAHSKMIVGARTTRTQNKVSRVMMRFDK